MLKHLGYIFGGFAVFVVGLAGAVLVTLPIIFITFYPNIGVYIVLLGSALWGLWLIGKEVDLFND